MKKAYTLLLLLTALCVGFVGCISQPGEATATVPADSTTDATQAPTDNTTLTPSQNATSDPSATGDASVSPSPSPTDETTSSPSPDATGPVAPGPTVSHEPVSEWDYAFTYGSASIKCTALTRFNDGTKGSGDGKFTFNSNGLLIQQANGAYADTYGIYSGANLLNADYSKTLYVGLTLENKEDHDVLFGLQGKDKNGKSIFLYPDGDPIALAYENGKLFAADGKSGVNGRYCFVIPANFKGSVLIPLNRIADSHVAADAKPWTKTPIADVGFHLSDGGSNGILLSTMFLCSTKLDSPGKVVGEIENPNYSYTNEQRIAAFWKQGTMYNESMAMIKQSNGSIYGTLLFVPTKINAVVDVYLKKEYKEGVDWVWEKGTNRIKWVKGSSIPYFTDDDLAGKGAPNYPNWSSDGRSLMGNCLYCVSAFLFEKQIAVSYTYDTKQVASEKIQYTTYQGDKLPKTVQKLKNNKDLKVLFYGDSIFSGCDASSMYNRAPFMPYMHKLIEAELQNHTKGKVQVDNIAVGGWTVQNGLTAINGGDPNPKAPIADYSKRYQGYDLLILSFGMNNGNTPIDEFKTVTKAIVDKIKAANPNLEVILVSCMNPNPRIGWDVNQKYQGAALKQIAQESKYSGYTAVVDFYAVHKSILQYKTFASTTGNNINHPNDWLIRVYAQNILAAMLK